MQTTNLRQLHTDELWVEICYSEDARCIAECWAELERRQTLLDQINAFLEG